jgi:hypothetical protein
LAPKEENLMRHAFLVIGATLLLAACSGSGTNGRAEPNSTFADPLCMPDGSVVFYEYANRNGAYDEVTASKANCAWNKRQVGAAGSR